ncbi:MAG: acyl-CoA thioesterase [Alphaproteobacteria bacterium]|nr:acyl-CoA thioesterase [Alphaproteobacteria bacterium]
MKTHIHRVSIEWGHCDPARIVFYPRYFEWIDEATRHLFESVGLAWKTLFDRYGVVGCPITEAKCNFLSPSRFGDIIEIESGVKEWRDKGFTVGHRIVNAGKLAVEGHEQRVWVIQHPDDPKRLKPVPVPAEVRAALAG